MMNEYYNIEEDVQDIVRKLMSKMHEEYKEYRLALIQSHNNYPASISHEERHALVDNTVKNLEERLTEEYPYTHKYKIFKNKSKEELEKILNHNKKKNDNGIVLDEEDVQVLQNKEILYLNNLSAYHIDLVEEYSIKLFDTTLNNYPQLKGRIAKIFELLEAYLLVDPNSYSYNLIKLGRHKYNENKTEINMLIDLKKKIKDVLFIAGTHIIDSPHHQKLKDSLTDLYNEPKKYMPKNYKSYQYKQPIQDYLYNLSLEEKKQIIKDFISKI